MKLNIFSSFRNFISSFQRRKDIKLLRESSRVGILFIVLLAVTSSFVDAALVYCLLPLSNLFISERLPHVSFLSFKLSVEPFLILAICLCALSPLLRYLNLRASSRFVAKLSNRIFHRCHSNILSIFDKSNDNYSVYLSLLTLQIDQVSGSLLNIIYLISNLLIVSSQIVLLLFITNIQAYFLIFFVVCAYFFAYRFSKPKLVQASSLFDIGSKRRSSLLMDSFKLNFEFYLRRSLDSVLELVSKQDYQIRLSQAQTIVLSTLPRFIVEAAVTSIIVGFVLFSYLQGDAGATYQILPILSVFLVASQKIIPSLQAIYSSVATIKYAKESVNSIFILYTKNSPPHIFSTPVLDTSSALPTIKEFYLNDVTYKSDSSLVFSNFSISIPMSKLTRIMGPSGCGKSTLFKLLTRQISPQHGSINLKTADNRILPLNSCFDYNFAYCGQKSNLISSSIRSNISLKFGSFDTFHDSYIWHLLEQTCLSEVVHKLPDRLDTVLTDDNPLLSGGEIQRLVITRSLFTSPQILFIDETTNAMDPEIEASILNNILSLTHLQSLIMIKHGEINSTFPQSIVNIPALIP